MNPKNDIDINEKYISIVEKIRKGISENGVTKKIKRKELISLKSSSNTLRLVIMEAGFFSLYRTEDKSFIAYQKAPSIMGFTAMFTNEINFYIKAEMDSIVTFVDIDSAMIKIKENDLWEALTFNMVYLFSRAIGRDQIMHNTSSYQRIKSTIIEYDSLPKEIKEELTLSGYIINRTSLSRSLIMNTLSSLNQYGYIIIERGKLIDINTLPDDYKIKNNTQ